MGLQFHFKAPDLPTSQMTFWKELGISEVWRSRSRWRVDYMTGCYMTFWILDHNILLHNHLDTLSIIIWYAAIYRWSWWSASKSQLTLNTFVLESLINNQSLSCLQHYVTNYVQYLSGILKLSSVMLKPWLAGCHQEAFRSSCLEFLQLSARMTCSLWIRFSIFKNQIWLLRLCDWLQGNHDAVLTFSMILARPCFLLIASASKSSGFPVVLALPFHQWFNTQWNNTQTWHLPATISCLYEWLGPDIPGRWALFMWP